jgi:outer membrane protein
MPKRLGMATTMLDRRLILALLVLASAESARGADPSVAAGRSGADPAAASPATDDGQKVGRMGEAPRLREPGKAPTVDELRNVLPSGFIVGAAAIHVPDRFSENERNFYAFPGFVYLGDRFMFLGDRMLYTVARGRQVTLNVNARYRFARLDPEGLPEFGTLGRRSDQLELGLGLTALTRIGFFTASTSVDASGRGNGQAAQAMWYLPFFRDEFLVMPSLGIAWVDRKFSNYDHGGVFPDEASPLLPSFDTGSTTAAIGNLVLGHQITPKWFVSAGAIHFRYSDNLEDSPILLDRGQTNWFTAVGYIWD